MTSLTMKTALFGGIFLFFFLEIRSETTTGQNNFNTTRKLSSGFTVQPPADADLPHNAPSPTVFDSKTVATSSSTDHRTATDKPRTASVTGTEKPTRRETPSITTTATGPKVNNTTGIKSPEEKSTGAKQPRLLPNNTAFTTTTTTTNVQGLTAGLLNNSTNTTPIATVTVKSLTSVSPKTKPQSFENTTGFPVSPKTSALSTSLTTTTNKSAITDTSMSTATTSALPENINATAASAITRGHNQTIQNITSSVLNQSSSAAEVTSPSAVNGTTLVNHMTTTEIHKNMSTTTPAQMFPTNMSVTTNATQGVWIPAITTTVPATSQPNSTDESTQPCSSIGVVKKCLIIIASLAIVATTFIVSTIILCTKLSSRKYRVRRQQQGTEMTCISSLLRERSHPQQPYRRQRSPVPNGVLVIHPCGDSDEDLGDNLTLSSFLPDNDRYV